FANEALRLGGVVGFSVADTGIGIARDKQQLIFEPFLQADGTTSRKYGGTGLGLSISREIPRLLGGGLHVQSEVGKGSAFTLYMPERHVAAVTDEIAAVVSGWAPPASFASVVGTPATIAEPDPIVTRPIDDDRASIGEDDRVLLVIEDDVSFARIMLQIGREKGFKVIVATRGDTGLALAGKYQPDAITLDIKLPGLDGLTLLDRLKRSPTTRHIPVHVISIDEMSRRGAALGAFA